MSPTMALTGNPDREADATPEIRESRVPVVRLTTNPLAVQSLELDAGSRSAHLRATVARNAAGRRRHVDGQQAD
jgi:hypothetical protein